MLIKSFLLSVLIMCSAFKSFGGQFDYTIRGKDYNENPQLYIKVQILENSNRVYWVVDGETETVVGSKEGYSISQLVDRHQALTKKQAWQTTWNVAIPVVTGLIAGGIGYKVSLKTIDNTSAEKWPEIIFKVVSITAGSAVSGGGLGAFAVYLWDSNSPEYGESAEVLKKYNTQNQTNSSSLIAEDYTTSELVELLNTAIMQF